MRDGLFDPQSGFAVAVARDVCVDQLGRVLEVAGVECGGEHRLFMKYLSEGCQCSGIFPLGLFGVNSDHMCSAFDIRIDSLQHRRHVDSTVKSPTVIGNCEHERQLPRSFLPSRFEVPGETNEQSTCKVILVDAVAELIKED